MVPTTVVVQLVPLAVSDTEVVEVGATAAMSGATLGSASIAASAVVSVVAEPKPPRMPVQVVLCRARR